jgi:hypothetical protein
MRRQILTLTLVFCVSYFGFGFACKKSQHDSDLAWAKDIATAFHTAEPYAVSLPPSLQAKYHKAVALADQVVETVAISDATTTAELLRDLIPIFNEVAKIFTDNKTVLDVLAIADIGLHVLLNHLPARSGIGAGATQGLEVLAEFQQQQIWGCAYHPELCQ